MPWISFNRKFDFDPPQRVGVTISYKAGRAYSVTRACAEKAIACGAGGRTSRPRPDGTAEVEAGGGSDE